MKTIPPGSTIGILGGGQLGRMTALAAAKLGYRSHIYCPDPTEPATAVAAASTIGDFKDINTLRTFASKVDVVTLEWENVPLETLQILAPLTTVHPSLDVLRVSQDREQEKTFCRRLGIGTTDFVIVHSAEELAQALKHFSLPAILKSCRMGYDGKGQVLITPEISAETAWREMGSSAGILEAFVDFDFELSVIVSRRADGNLATYPAVKNIHQHHILAETHAMGDIDIPLRDEAERIARLMAEELKVVGLLTVEMFALKSHNKQGHHILVNEMAPRPHNSGHWTMDACTCSQFEQLVRAVCGLPLGSTIPHSRAIMHNLIGDSGNDWDHILHDPHACLHLYGKSETKPGRKMGHVNYLKGAW